MIARSSKLFCELPICQFIGRSSAASLSTSFSLSSNKPPERPTGSDNNKATVNNASPTPESIPGANSSTNAPKRTSKLMTVLAGMKVERSTVSRGSPAEEPRKSPMQRPITIQGRTKQPEKPKLSVEPELVDAVQRVAEAFAPVFDPVKTESELLTRLMKHAQQTEKSRVASSSKEMSHLIAGMKIDRSKPKPELGSLSPGVERAFAVAQEPIRGMMEASLDDPNERVSQKDFAALSRRRPASIQSERVDLFGAEPLGIFTNFKGSADPKETPAQDTWQRLEQEQLDAFKRQPPKNAFEEMIIWTNKGMMWQFPIDNEQGFEREKDVHFSEHIFLDKLIEDFPKGPIKQFMEVVIYGLSNNSYLSVQEKMEHVDWFRQYFKEKRQILVESMGVEFAVFKGDEGHMPAPGPSKLLDTSSVILKAAHAEAKINAVHIKRET